MRRHRQRPEPFSAMAQWVTTFNDLVTVLTVFFLMIFAISAIDVRIGQIIGQGMRKGLGVLHEGRHAGVKVLGPGRQQSEEKKDTDAPAPSATQENAESAPSAIRSTGQALQHLADEQGLTVTATASGVTLTLPDKLLFDSGRAQIRQPGRKVLDRVAAVLAPVSGTVRVEGHSDDAPIQTPAFPSNWELSIARAVNVVKHLSTEGALPGQRLSAVGYADARPLVPNTGAANRALNRRVEIVVEMAAVPPEAAGSKANQPSGQPGH